MAVQRHPHLKIYFFHVVWHFNASLSQKLGLFSYVMHCALITYFVVNIIGTLEYVYIYTHTHILSTHRSCRIELAVCWLFLHCLLTWIQ